MMDKEMSAKIIVPVCWLDDKNDDEYDIGAMLVNFKEQLEELTGDTMSIVIERSQGNGTENILQRL